MSKKERPVFDTPAIFELRPPKPVGIHVIIRPRPASERIGSGLLVSAKNTQKADMSLRTIGEVVAIGALAYQSPTRDLDPRQDPVAQSIRVGSWVAYRQHSGQKLKRKRGENLDAPEFLVQVQDLDVLSVFDNEAHALEYYDWVE